MRSWPLLVCGRRRGWGLPQGVVAGVGHHADHHPRNVPHDEGSAHGVDPRPEALCRGGVDHRHGRGVRQVLLAHEASPEPLNAHGGEVALAHAVEVRQGRAVLGVHRPSVRNHGAPAGNELEGQALGEGGRLDAGQRIEPGQRLPLDLASPLLADVQAGEVPRGRGDPVRVEAEVQRQRCPEALRHEARAAKQDAGQGDLDHHQASAHPGRGTSRAPPPLRSRRGSADAASTRGARAASSTGRTARPTATGRMRRSGRRSKARGMSMGGTSLLNEGAAP